MVFVLAPFGSYAALWINREDFVSYLVEAGTPQDYLDAMVGAAHWWVLPAIIIGNIICSYLSGKFGQKLLRKQFEKAGIV